MSLSKTEVGDRSGIASLHWGCLYDPGSVDGKSWAEPKADGSDSRVGGAGADKESSSLLPDDIAMF